MSRKDELKDAIEYLKYDLQVLKAGLKWLAEIELIELIGKENWFAKQI